MENATSIAPSYNVGPRKAIAKVTAGSTTQRSILGNLQNNPIHRFNGTSNLKESFKNNVCNNNIKKSISSAILHQKNKLKINNENFPLNKKELKEEKADALCDEDLSKAFSSQLLNVKDIDQDDVDNPQLVSVYAKDIYKYLWKLEDEYPVKAQYLDGCNITGRMRAILIDWLVQVHTRFSLLQETLYLTVSIIDRYLQVNKSLKKDKLQLVGVTAMFVACKYEEMYLPELSDFVHITDDSYTRKEIRLMEIEILHSLNFFIGFPLHLHFLRRNSKAGEVDAQHHNLAKYLMELTLPEYSFCHYKVSLVAAAALYLSVKLLSGKVEWGSLMHCYSSYSEQEVLPVVQKLAGVVIRSFSAKQQAIRNKYKSSKLMKISEIPQLSPSSKLLKEMASKV